MEKTNKKKLNGFKIRMAASVIIFAAVIVLCIVFAFAWFDFTAESGADSFAYYLTNSYISAEMYVTRNGSAERLSEVSFQNLIPGEWLTFHITITDTSDKNTPSFNIFLNNFSADTVDILKAGTADEYYTMADMYTVSASFLTEKKLSDCAKTSNGKMLALFSVNKELVENSTGGYEIEFTVKLNPAFLKSGSGASVIGWDNINKLWNKSITFDYILRTES